MDLCHLEGWIHHRCEVAPTDVPEQILQDRFHGQHKYLYHDGQEHSQQSQHDGPEHSLSDGFQHQYNKHMYLYHAEMAQISTTAKSV